MKFASRAKPVLVNYEENKMRSLITLIALMAGITANANERIDIAKRFTGAYELKVELHNDHKEACAPELRVKYWNSEKFLDLQFLNPNEGIFFVNQQPSLRQYLENSYVFDVINKVNISEDEKYKTVTRINSTRIEERTYKGKPDKYKVRSQVFFSVNPFNKEVRYETIDKKNERKECLYSRI